MEEYWWSMERALNWKHTGKDGPGKCLILQKKTIFGLCRTSFFPARAETITDTFYSKLWKILLNMPSSGEQLRGCSKNMTRHLS